MKKSKLFVLSAASLLLATSCAEDNSFARTDTEGNVSFTVTLPGDVPTSRAFGDGLSANNLIYAVYDSNDAYVTEDTARFETSLSTTVNLTLANGQSYKIAFFAYNNSNSVYAFSSENNTVTVNYSNMAKTSSASKDYDCFYKMEELTVTGPVQKDVTLTRPMAQINWGTNDMNTTAVTSAYGTKLKTKFSGKAYSKLNILTGEASEEVDVVPDKTTNPIESSVGTFPVSGYDYLNMIYLLVPQSESSLVDCKLEVYKSSTLIHTVNVPNVPVERNYRTNIYGALLTSDVEIKVEKDANWNSSYNQEIWKGEVKMPEADADGNYAITSSAELAGIAKMVNEGNNLSGKTVSLKVDLDLNNVNWTPIGIGDGNTTEMVFNGTFDGEGHTIKNLTVNLDGKPSVNAGLFGRAWGEAKMSNVTIENVNIDVTGVTTDASHGAGALIGAGKLSEISNVTVKNAKIKANHYAGGITGNYYGNIKDCEVSGIEIVVEPRLMVSGDKANKYDLGDKAGAIFGYHGEGNYTVSGNKATDVKITGFRDLGGMFGAIQNNVNYSNNSITNGEVLVSLTNADKLCDDSKWGNIGEVVGRKFTNAVDGGGNTYENVSLYKPTESVSTLEQLASAITSGGYIGIAENASISVTGSVTVSKPTMINLPEGASINMGANTINNKSDMTIKGGGTVTGSSFILDNVGGNMIVEGGTFKTTGSSAQPIRNDAGSLTINGGYFEAVAGAAVTTNFVNGNTGELEINGGTFVNKSSGQYALNMYGDGEFTINGGKYVGYFGCARAENGANVVINGGYFICNGEGNTYYALALNAEPSSNSANVTVNGGNFWSSHTTLYCRENASLTLNGGQYKAIDNANAKVGAGFKSIDITDQKTVTVDGQSIICTFAKAVVAE